MASITLIGRDGDARRIVECEDFAALTAAHERAARHPISLPSTSGYLDSLRAQGMGFTVSVDRPIQRDEPRRKDFKSVLRFNKPAGYPQPASYSYQWHAVNAFALDTRQFNYKYGRDPERLDDIEFTHFTTDDPVEDLTVVVRFPPGYRLKTPPRVRIAEVNADVPDARKWIIDVEMQDRLKSTHALRYYESLSIAALRVKYPRRGLSYGIQWDVPDAVNAASSSPEAEDLVMRIQAAPLDRARRARLVETLARIFIAARQGILKNWTGPLDGGLMYFDGVRTLPLLAAAQEQRGSLGKFARKELLYTTTLNYGDGIAGRAFKANRPRVYVLPGNMESDGPDYYVHLEGSPAHKVLLCLPVHVPVETAVFDANPRIYETKAPYGVVSLGSTFGDCPLNQFQRQETTPKLLRFHHDMNELVFGAMRSLFLEPEEMGQGGS